MKHYEILVENARKAVALLDGGSEDALAGLIEELANAVEELDTELTTWIEGETGI